MPAFLYIGPAGEPDLPGTYSARAGDWVKGVPREIADAGAVAWLRRHPHWQEVMPKPARLRAVRGMEG